MEGKGGVVFGVDSAPKQVAGGACKRHFNSEQSVGLSMNPGIHSSALSAPRRIPAARARRLREVLDDYVRRRADGESIDRAAFMAAHSELMPALAEELELLRLMDNAVRRSSNGASGPNPPYPRTFALPERVGAYRIERELQRGAQGVVYQARQESTGRTVAVKVLHPAALGRAAESARFVREVEVLARLRHPHIVSVLDSGVADGCHYFAMDYVEGLALDEELALRPRPLHATLRLFTQVADAIAAAHLRGVIHRDLKPGNIRVDGAGNAHVLDFGLAKLTEERGAASMTADGQFLGSLPWASPEQIGSANDVDVRSDVYSLGVILYQMLTRQFPYSVVGPIPEVIATITTAEPKRPSRVASGVGSELDTIVLKCLSKSPSRRYQSAAELAVDVRRFLADEPIEARRDSTLYVVGKHMRRHRWPVAVAGVALTALVTFAFYSAAQAAANRRLAESEQRARVAAEAETLRASAAQREADRERDAANAARESEAALRRIADFEAGRANAVAAFFARTFGATDPDVSQVGSVTLRSLLDRAAEEVDSAFANDAASEATVRAALGRAYATLGRLQQARPQLERAVELHESSRVGSPTEQYETRFAYTNVLEEFGTREEWRTHWRQLWKLYPGLVEADSPPLAVLLRALTPERLDAPDAARLEQLFGDVLESAAATLPTDSDRWPVLADFLHLAAARLESRARTPLGGRLLREALRLQRNSFAATNLRVVRTLDALISNYLETEQFAEAETLARETVVVLREGLADDHWFVALSESQLAVCLARQGRIDEAEGLILSALPRVEQGAGAESASAIEVAARLAGLYEAAGRHEDADLCRASIAARMAVSPDVDVVVRLPWAMARRHAPLAVALQQLSEAERDRARDIEPLVQDVLALRRELVSEREPLAALIAEFLWYHAKAYCNRVGFDAQTRALLDEAHALAAAVETIRVEKRGTIDWWLAYQFEWSKDFVSAEPLARSALACFEQQRPRNERLIALGRSLLGSCLSGLSRREDAEPLLIQGFQGTLRRVGPRQTDTEVALRRLIRHFDACDRLVDAAPFVRSTMSVHNGNVEHMLQMVVAQFPQLAERLRQLRGLKSPQRRELQRSIEELIAARASLLAPESPFAAFYSDALYGILDTAAHGARTSFCDLWLPAAAEVLAIHELQYGPNHCKTTFAQWWHAATLLAAGEYSAAEALSQQVHELRRTQLLADFPAGYTRFEPLIARARLELGQLIEPASELLAVYERAREEHGPHSFHTTEAFGHVLRAFVVTGQPQRASDFAMPILRRALETSTDARPLSALSWKVAQHPALPQELYELASDIARRALERRPLDSATADLLGLALLRSGNATEALQITESSSQDDRGVLRAFVRATALRQLGEHTLWPDVADPLRAPLANDQVACAALRALAEEFCAAATTDRAPDPDPDPAERHGSR